MTAPSAALVDDHPLFPLETALVPGVALTVRVFEPRYLTLVGRLGLAADGDRVSIGRAGPLGHFGVVLVERGSEVGGGDERRSVGVAVAVRRAAPAEGRWLLELTALRRCRVERWLPDDPHPRGVVRVLDDETPDPGPDGAELVATVVGELLRLVRLVRVLGPTRWVVGAPLRHLHGPRPPRVDPSDPRSLTELSWWVAATAPLGPLDRQSLLEAPDPVTRLVRARRLLGEAADLAERLGPADGAGTLG